MNLILEIEICHKTTGYNFSQRKDLEGKVIIKKFLVQASKNLKLSAISLNLRL